MFELFTKHKSEEPKTTHYLSLFWYPDEQIVRFNAFFNIMQVYDLKVIDMSFMSNVQTVDGRNMIKFAVTGTYRNLEAFENYIPLLESMEPFKPRE